MKTTPIQYAKALLASVEGKQQSEVDAVIARFADRLRRDGQLRRLHAIVGAFSALWNKAHGITDAVVTSRERLNDAVLDEVKRFIMQRYHAKQVTVVNRVDATIRGGIVIQVGDELIDGSIAAQLKKLKKNLVGTSTSNA